MLMLMLTFMFMFMLILGSCLRHTEGEARKGIEGRGHYVLRYLFGRSELI